MSENNGEFGRRDFPVTVVVRGWIKDEASAEMTLRCVQSLEFIQTPMHVVVVLNDAAEKRYDTLNLLYEMTDTVVLFDRNYGAVRATNAGLQLAMLDPSEYVLVLDNDTEFPEGDTNILDRWLAHFDDPQVGAVGATTDYVAGPQCVAMTPFTYTKEFDGGHVGPVSPQYLISFACMYRKSALLRCVPPAYGHAAIDAIKSGSVKPEHETLQLRHLWDERFTPGNSEDLDISVRIRLAGYGLVIARDVYVHHKGSESFKALDDGKGEAFNRLLEQNQQKLVEKWGPYVGST